jgi:hypothetical protein
VSINNGIGFVRGSNGSSRVLTAALCIGLGLVFGPSSGQTAGGSIVTYSVEYVSGASEQDVPVTFGAVFVQGDVPAGATISATDGSGRPVPLQVDVKARHADGSLRHAVLTAVFAHMRTGATESLALHLGPNPQASPIALSDLPKDLDASATLTSNGSKLTASLRDMLARGKPETWLSGPSVSEWWFSEAFRDSSGKPDAHLSARFGVRSYGRNRPVRIEIDVENTSTWTPLPHTAMYDAEISLGGRSVWTKATMAQPAHTRWRKVFWLNDPLDVYVG